MPTEDALKINLKSLPEGTSTLDFALSDDFFSIAESGEISGGSVDVRMEISRHGDRFRLLMTTAGRVRVCCDRCLDTMEQPISSENSLLIILGELPEECSRKATQYTDDGEMMTVDAAYGIADLSWFVYESIALAVPTRHIHAPGQCNDAMVERLEDLAPALNAARSSEDAAADIDPRWNALKQLKTENNEK